MLSAKRAWRVRQVISHIGPNNPSQYIFIYDIGVRLSHRIWIDVQSPSRFARGDANFILMQSHLSKIGTTWIPGFLLKEKRDKGERGWDRGWYQEFDLHLQSCTENSHFITGISHDFEKCEKLGQVTRYLKRNFFPYCNNIFIQNSYIVSETGHDFHSHTHMQRRKKK